jgi:hypothetical protein
VTGTTPAHPTLIAHRHAGENGGDTQDFPKCRCQKIAPKLKEQMTGVVAGGNYWSSGAAAGSKHYHRCGT